VCVIWGMASAARREIPLEPEDELELVGLAQQGNRDAVETLLERHELAVFRACRRLLPQGEDVEGAVQETMLRAWRTPAVHDQSGGSARGWLFTVAKRIVQHEVHIDPSLLCTALEAAVSTINGSPEAHVLLSPAAVEPVAQAWEALHGRAYLGKKWFFEGDPTLPVGGCTLRYEHGFVEAGLESQLEEIGIALDRAIPGLARGTVEEEVA